MCSCLDPMAQDIPEQDIVMGELELPPQMDTEPEMGAAAAAVYDTSPSLLRNPPPILAESAQPGTFDMGRLLAVLARMNENMNAKMDGMAQTMWEEMQCMGAGLQNGLEGVKEGQEQLKKEQGEIKKGLEDVRKVCERRHLEITERVENLRQEVKEEMQKGLEVVKEECKVRNEEIAGMVRKVERETRETTEGLERRREKHEGETQKGLAEVRGEMEQIREEFGELSLGTQEGRGREEELKGAVERKIEDMGRKLAERVETRCERQEDLLREQGEKIRSLEAGRAPVGPASQDRVSGLPDAGVCMTSLGGIEAAGSFGLMRGPGMTVPVGVQNVGPMAWESKRDEAGHGQTWAGVVDSPGKWLGPCGSAAPLGLGRYTPPGVPREL